MSDYREQEILLTKRLFSAEVDRILTELDVVVDPVLRARAEEMAQRDFNRLDHWFWKQMRESA